MIFLLFSAGGTDCALIDWYFFDNFSKNFFSWSARQFILKLPDSLLFITKLILQWSDFTLKSIYLWSVNSTRPIGASSINIASTSICSSRTVFNSGKISLQTCILVAQLINNFISLVQFISQHFNTVIGIIQFLTEVSNFIIKSLVLLLEIQDCSLDWRALSSLSFKLSSNFIQFLLLETTLSSHLFNGSLKLFTLSLEFFGIIFVFLSFSLLRFMLLAKVFSLSLHLF